MIVPIAPPRGRKLPRPVPAAMTIMNTTMTMNMNIITTRMASVVVDMTTSMDIITIMRTMYLQAWVSRVRTNTVRKN